MAPRKDKSLRSVFCEHCGQLETNTAQFQDDDGIQWCAWCAYANGLISDEQYNLEIQKEHNHR